MGAAFDAILRAAFTLLTSPILWQAFWDVIVASIALNETIKTRIQDKIKEVGMSIVEGIVLGIEAKAGEVATAIEDWIMENVVTVVKKALHMASPSKVMIQLGEEVGEGFILGIEASSDDVLKAVVNMADKVVSLVQGMVEAFEGMAKAPVTTHLAAWGQAISDALTVVMNALVALYDYAGGPQANKIDLARRLAVTFDNVVGFVQDAADALASLNTVDVLAVTKEKVQGFMDAVTIILEAIKEATGIWSAGLTGTKGEKTIDETFAPARKFVEQIAAMLSVVELAVTSINHMATLNLAKDIKAKARDFATGLNTLLVEIFKATDIWTHKTPDEMGAAASFAQSAQQMLSVVTVAVEAITSLFDFAPARDLPEKAKIFAAGLNYVLVEIYKASLIWKDTGLEAAALFAANAEQVIAIISSAIEAISQLGTFTAVTDMRAKARAFAANIVALMDELDKALIALVLPSRGAPTVPLTAEEISERFAALGAFGEAVEGGIGFIQSAISAISSISGFKAIGGLGEKVRTFMEQVISLMANLEDALLTTLMEPSGKVPDVAYTPEKIIERFGKLIAFSDAVQTGIGFIQPALDAIASLTDYVVVEGLGKTVHAFASQVVSLMSNLEDAMIEIMEPSGMAPTTPFTPEKITERFSRLAAFASAVQAGIGFIAPAIEAIAKLATFTPIASLGKKAHGFAEQVISLMSNLEDALISIMEPSGATPVIQFTPEQIVERFAKLASFSEAVQKGIGFIAPSIDALLKLGEFERVKDLKKKLQWLTADLEELLLQFSYMARLWIAQTAEGVFQSEALSKLGDFATKVAAAVGFIVPSIEALGEVRKYKAASNLVKDIGAFTHDLSLLLEELGKIAEKLAGDQGLGRAVAFENAAAAISGAVSRGLELLGVLSIETGDAPAGFASSIRGALLEIKTAAKDLQMVWVDAWGAITTAVQLATQAVNEFKTALADVTIPEDLAPGSPPPFAYAMQDIALATRRAKEEFGLLRGELRAYTLPSSVMAAQTAAAVANNNVNVNMGGVAINNGMDEAILAAKVRRWVKEAMRP